ncbi:histidyl-tRNA synthetase, partial [Lacticaseibacillus rhamnosus MTCC 5462]
GESEREAGTVQVKNMATGQQKAFPQADVLADFSKFIHK